MAVTPAGCGPPGPHCGVPAPPPAECGSSKKGENRARGRRRGLPGPSRPHRDTRLPPGAPRRSPPAPLTVRRPRFRSAPGGACRGAGPTWRRRCWSCTSRAGGARGGGPVRSCQRLGPLLFLTFESPQDAENILARGTHQLGGVYLGVCRAPPWDPSHLLLGGLDPQTPTELLEPRLEPLLGRPHSTFELHRGPAPGWGLLHLQDPLTPPELAAAQQRAGGCALALLRVPQTPSLLVRAEVPALSPDLLELYFENRRSGGGSVQQVQLLPGGRAAIVTFQELAAAQRVLQRPHRLQDTALALAPHYPFLGMMEGDTEPPSPDKEPPPPDTDPPTDTKDLLPATTDPSTDTGPQTDMDPPPDTAPVTPSAPAIPAEPLTPTPAAISSATGDPEGPKEVAWDEVVVVAEPGALRYLQQHYQDLLGSIPEASVLPLEGGDVSGFRVSGETEQCRAAAEFLQSLLGTVGTWPVTLQFPGVARFLRDEAGQKLLQQLEKRFQCVIDLDGVSWSPPDPQQELVELLPPRCHQDPLPPQSWHQDLPDDASGADGDGFQSSIEEIKELLAALRPGDGDGDAGDIVSWKQDPDAEPPTVGDDGTEDMVWGEWGFGVQEENEEEEEAQIVLAIQRSMDAERLEEEELARATALSLHSYQEEEAEAGGLLAALEASLEEALPAADTAQVTVFSAQDAAMVPAELERVLAGQLRAEEVPSERLWALPGSCRHLLALLQRRHAVRLCLRPGTATLHGFAPYTAAAARDLQHLLQCLPEPEGGPGNATATSTCWVRWDPSGTAVPYSPEAVALLERAWQCRQRRLDLLRDGRPVTVDLQRMEEFDIGSARASPVSRSRPPTESARRLLELGLPGLEEEEVRLLPLAESSEEFRDTIRHFYGTLQELHNRISIVQVQKLIHPLLYRQYQLKKASMERACAGAAVERILFHGTTETSSREICLHGFNRSFCGKNAALYGLGVYFAVDAAVSAREQYSPCSANGTKFIFMAKVLTGLFARGGPGLRAPPLREGAGAPLRYHSVVDNPHRPAIFVIFNDTQAYPQYLITCRCRGAPHSAPHGPSEPL
ncbi:protein mono-ADP-ribosyltransferase PARP10 [Apus apus]|uniref:protein mono-ADP-ribosyltransferase PARP10 n=1 Tax=Apus apus TaxID=8895 RepID=UPI0021F897E0|nr:protein mono-ADP-ribosyltransferase PARP10 [Apus apus]